KGRRKKEEGRRKKEEGRRKKEEGRRKKEEGRRGSLEDGRAMNGGGSRDGMTDLTRSKAVHYYKSQFRKEL
ncbi:MAG TPA: hypothetical protein VLH56_03030, partial [Dissulfurispiraceae bacterium]|nr:hypothetical protein [Dissulfurispiraceae bacterium]